MLKKTTAIILIMILTLSISSPAYAALPDESQTTPRSVEEILNDHHTKIFELENQPAASTYSRSTVTEESITQDTISELQNAGYEAYNVTASNYDTLEAELQTDFASMGLDPDGSYIVVISGEDQPEDDGIAPASNDLLLPPHTDDGTSSYFTYTYKGKDYIMRYVAVTTAMGGGNMSANSVYILQKQYWVENAANDIFNTFLVGAADSLFEKIPFGTIISLCYDWTSDPNYIELEPNTLAIHATTTWTCIIIQVWNASAGRWETAQCSSYAISRAKCAGYLLNPTINDSEWYDGVEYCITQYPPKYSSKTQRQTDAAIAYDNSSLAYDCIGNISFYLGNSTGSIIYDSSTEPLFTHLEDWSIPLYG